MASWVLDLSSYSGVMLTLLFVALNCGAGHYRASIAPSLLDELPSLVGRALVAGAIATSLRVFGQLPIHDGLVYAAMVCALLAVAGRAVAYPLLRVHRSSGGKGDPTIIVGCGKVGKKLANTLLEHPEYGLRPVGFVDDDPLLTVDEPRRCRVLGGPRQLASTIAEYGRPQRRSSRSRRMPESEHGRRPPHLRPAALRDLLRAPAVRAAPAGGRDNDMAWGLPLVRLRRAPFRTPAWRVKRAFDVVVSAVALLLSSRRCSPPARSPSGSRAAPGCCSARSGSASTAGRSSCSSSGRCGRGTSIESQTRWNISATTGSAGSDGSCASRRWTSCRSCGTSCAAT